MKILRRTEHFDLEMDSYHGAVLRDRTGKLGHPIDIAHWSYGPGWETILGLLDLPMHDDDFDRMAMIFFGVSAAEALAYVPMGEVEEAA